MNQTEVARAMARVASVDKPDFVISTGDNFYVRNCPLRQFCLCTLFSD